MSGTLQYDVQRRVTWHEALGRCVSDEHGQAIVIYVNTRRLISTITTPEREVRVGAFPIGIDYRDFAQHAACGTVARRTRQLLEAMPARQVILCRGLCQILPIAPAYAHSNSLTGLFLLFRRFNSDSLRGQLPIGKYWIIRALGRRSSGGQRRRWQEGMLSGGDAAG
jgi:hypothetical protein